MGVTISPKGGIITYKVAMILLERDKVTYSVAKISLERDKVTYSVGMLSRKEYNVGVIS